jgi:2-polyprenyl-3-methyl-5-hydroxy-6-metoxy-1,4-benzoquinol methylase
VNDFCPICGSANVTTSIKNYFDFDLLKCASCLGEFAKPFKGPSIDFYDNAADEESTRRHTVQSKWHHAHPTWHSELLKNGNGKAILDLGCGNGDFAEFAISRGFTVIGLDIDKEALKVAKSRNLENAEFLNSTLFEFLKYNPSTKFDLVSMFEVFEHVDTPNDTIAAIKQLLKPNGHFIGSMPNEDRYFAKKVNLTYALPPYHLMFWNKKSFDHYLSTKHGLAKHSSNNNVYYGYLTNTFYFRIINKFNIGDTGLVNFLLQAIAFPIRKIEAIVEKATDKAGCFYFEYKLPSSQKN